MHVSPFTSLDGPRRNKSWTVDFGSTTGTCPKAVDLIHTYKYPSSCYHFFFLPPLMESYFLENSECLILLIDWR